MVTKGIIKSIDLTGNTCKVHMPFFETAGNDPIIATAIISNTPGSYNGYKVGDVVLVAFEDNNLDTPVVMGKLYLGVEKEKADPRGVLNVEESSTSKKAALPADSVLTSKVDSNVTNTAAPFGSLSSIANELNTLNTNVDQMDRDYGNRFKQVITEIGSQGENFESKLEQTAQSITATVTSTKEELQENIDAVQDNVDQTNKDLADAKDNFSKTITETKTALEVEDGKIKASVEEVSKTVTAHGETIASHTTQISQNTESITLEASARQEAVSNLDKSISDNAALIKENTANIKINADSISQEVTAREEALSGAVKELESKITSTSDGINAQVTERLSEKLDIKNNGESTTEEGQVVQHGFGWDLSKDEWLIKAYDQNSEGTLPTDGLDIFKITRDTVEINAPHVRLTGYPRETIVRYAYGTKDTYPALYKDNTKKSIKDELINTAWSKTELPWSETQYIWQWTQTAKYEYVEENSSWIDTITDNVVRQSGDSAVSYWLKCSTPIHIGKNQTENILVIPYKKVGTKSEELDTEAYVRYKWVKDTNAEFTSWTKISSSGLTINATDVKASDLLVQVSHDSTGDNRVIYDEETITYSPLNTPIIDLTNDKATIQYKPNGDQITASVSSTATVYLGGTPLSGTTYKWKKKEGTTSITGTNTSTITVNSITSDTAIITCEATTPFKDETGANVVLSKDFTIFKETVAATYKLKISTPIHTGDLQKASIKVEALTTLGNNPELPDENAYLRYSLNNGTTWQSWIKQSEREIVTTGCESDIIVQASHDSGTTVYEQETITYSPLNTPVLDLSNDNATIPYNADDTKLNTTENVSSTAVVYLNGKVFNSYKIDWSSPDESCVYTLNEDKHTITITDINNISNSNIATARCTVSEIEGYPNLELIKDFTIIKQVQGVISYSLKTSIDNFVRDTNNVINPTNLTFQIIEKVGNKNSSFVIPTTANKLRLEVFKGTTPLSLTADENNIYTTDNTNININTPIIIKLYQESTLIETKTINVIYSGEKGEAGESNYIIEIDNDFATVPTSIVNKQIYRKDGLVDLPKNDSSTPKISLPGGVFSPKNIVKTNILNDENASNLSITNVLRFTPTLNTRAIVNKHLPGIPLSIISDTSAENNYKFLRAPLISLPETQLEIKDSTNTVTEYKSYTQDLTTHNVKVYYGTALETITADNFILKLDHDEITLEDLYTENGNYLVCEIRAYDKDGNLVDDCPSINPTISNNTITNYITAMSGTTSTVSTVSIIYTYYIVRELDGQKIMTNVASSKVELVRHLGPTTYYMNSSATSIKVDKNNNVTPTSINFTAHKLSTSNNNITDFTTGTWKYYWNNDTSNIQTLNNSGSLTINNGNTIYFKDKNTLTVELYTNDQLWDRTTIDIIKDGTDGQDGREITKITTYYIYSAEKPAVDDPKWTEDLSELSEDDLPKGGYYCWRKTVTEYTDGNDTVDGPTRDETFALAQGKTTNYYSPTDPAGIKNTANYGQNIKEGDCWFKTSVYLTFSENTATDLNYNKEDDSDNIAGKASLNVSDLSLEELYTNFYIYYDMRPDDGDTPEGYYKISKDSVKISESRELYYSRRVWNYAEGDYEDLNFYIGFLSSDLSQLETFHPSLYSSLVQKTSETTLYQWDGSQWQDIGGELVANKVTANFINALDITAKKVTILQNSKDESSPILFEADGTGSTGKVKIGGFDVSGSELTGTNKIDGIDYRVSVSPEQIFLGTTNITDSTDAYVQTDTPNTDIDKFLLGTIWEAVTEEFYKDINSLYDGEYDDTQVSLLSTKLPKNLSPDTSSSTQLPYFSLKATYTNSNTNVSTTYVDYYYFYKNTFLTLPENQVGNTYSLWKRFRWVAMKGEPEFKNYESYFTTEGEFNNSDETTLYEILNKANTVVYLDPCLITPHIIELSTIKATKFNVSNKGNLIANSGTVGAFKLDDYSLTAFQKSEDTSITPIGDAEKAEYKDAANLDILFKNQKTEVNLSPKGLKLSLSEVEEGAKTEDQTNRLTLRTTPLGSINLDPAIGITAGALQVSNTGSSDTSTIDTEGNTLSKELDYPFKVSLDGNLKATAANIGGWSLHNVELYNRDQGIILNKDGLNLTNGKLIQLANKNFKVITQEKKDNAGTFWDTDNITYIGNNNGGTLIRGMNANGSLFLTSDNVESFTQAEATLTLTVTGTRKEAKISANTTRANTTLPYSLPEKRTITVSYSYIIASGLFNLFETTKTGSVTLTINKDSSSSDTKILNLNGDEIKNGTTVKIELTPDIKTTLTASDNNVRGELKSINYLKFLVSEADGNTGAIYSLGHLLPNTFDKKANNQIIQTSECNLGSIQRPWTTLYVENIWVEKINGKPYKDWNAQTGTESTSDYNFNNKAGSTCVNPGWPDEGTNILDVTNKTEVTTKPITGGTCFDAGTKVTMADGSLKNIEDVKIDDIVLSYNVYTNSFDTAKVLDTYKFNTTQDLVLLTFEDGTQIHTTMTHPFYTTSGWVSLKPNYDYNSYEDLSTQLFEMMTVGQYFYQTTSNNELKELKLVRIQYKHGVNKDHFVYNLNIDNTNTFFAEGILGHNVMVKANPGFNIVPML